MNYEPQQIDSLLDNVRNLIAEMMAEPGLDLPVEIMHLISAQLEDTAAFLGNNALVPTERAEAFKGHVSFISNVARIFRQAEFMRLHAVTLGISGNAS